MVAKSRNQSLDLDAILDQLGRHHWQQAVARDAHPHGSPEWHRLDQGRWAFREAALCVDRSTGHTRDIYGAWLNEWSPADTKNAPVR